MRFYQFILRNVFRRRVRSALTMTGMAMAVGTVVALVGISEGFKKSFLELYQNRGVDLIVARTGATNMLNGVMPEEVYKKIAALDGVQGVAPGLIDIVSFENLGLYNKVMQGWPLDSFMFKETRIIDGELLSEKHAGKKGILLGKSLAQQMKKKAGDTITIFESEEYQVVGVFESFSPLENDGMVILLDDMQKLSSRPGLITGCSVKLKASTNIDQVRDHVRHQIENDIASQFHLKGKIQATPAQDLASSAMQLKAATAFAWLTSAIALIMGAVFMLNTMVMSVFERTREIGILRAIGWRPRRVMRMILMESLILSISGGIVGTIGAITLTWSLSRVPAVGGFVRGDISIAVIVQGFAIALLVGLIGAAYPAYRGARLMPTEAIRHE
jgi:putative ABC transport system permease protein